METVTNDDTLEEYKDNIKLIEEEDDDNIEEIEEVNDDVDNIDIKTEKKDVIRTNVQNSQYASKTVKDLRKIIADNYEYADMFKHSMKKSHTKARKESLISFLDNLDNVKVSYSAAKSLKKERLDAYENNKVNKVEEEKEKEIEKKEIEKEIIDSSNVEKQNEIYKNTQDDLNKLKNNKKINDNVNPYSEPKQEEEEEEDLLERSSTEEEDDEKKEIEEIKYRIGLYFERFPWLKGQTYTSTIANPRELIKEIELKVSSRNMSSLFKSQFFVTLANLEDLNEKYGQGYIRARGITSVLERNDAFKDALDELMIKYSSKFSALMSVEMRLALVVAQSLYAVDSFNRDAEERDNLKQKKINEDHINKYSDL